GWTEAKAEHALTRSQPSAPARDHAAAADRGPAPTQEGESAAPGTDQEQRARARAALAERPRVVSGLEAVRHTARGVPYVMLHNPATHTYLRLEPSDYE